MHKLGIRFCLNQNKNQGDTLKIDEVIQLLKTLVLCVIGIGGDEATLQTLLTVFLRGES